MNESRDSIQTNLVAPSEAPEVAELREEVSTLYTHIDRLYERCYDMWDFLEKLSDCVASPPPLPLKYK